MADRKASATADPSPRPSGWRRMFSTWVDWTILTPPIAAIALAMGVLTLATSSLRSENYEKWISQMIHVSGVLNVITAALAIVYFSILHGWRGQTFGKIACKLRVVNMNITPISWRKATARAFAYYGVILLYCVVFFTKDNLLITAIGSVVTIWLLTDTIFQMADTHQHRSLHDRICGTRVIQIR